MASSGNRIYHSRNPVKIILTVILIVVIIAITVMIIIFFSFQKYITYTSDGIRMDVPWLQYESEDIQSEPDTGEVLPDILYEAG